MPATARPGPLTVLPSGEQFEIRADGQRATIVEVGGGLREYEVDSRPVIEPYSVDRMRDGAHGAPLIPWPNRLARAAAHDPERHKLEGARAGHPERVIPSHRMGRNSP